VSEEGSVVADPDGGIASLRNLMVPENMKASQALKDFLLSKAASGAATDPAQATVDLQQTLSLLISSHLEVINVLGAMEHNAKSLKAQLTNLSSQQGGRHAAKPSD
jgi:hypothetical protein